MYYLNQRRVFVRERALRMLLAHPDNTLPSKDAAQAKPHQPERYPDQQLTSGKTINEMFEPIASWGNTETRRVGRRLRRHLTKVIQFAKDPRFEQALKERVERMLASEETFAEKVAYLDTSQRSKGAAYIPHWRTHQIVFALGFEFVSETFGMLLQQDPYYQISTVRKERVFIFFFTSELHHSDKQDIFFWMKQGGTLVYKCGVR